MEDSVGAHRQGQLVILAQQLGERVATVGVKRQKLDVTRVITRLCAVLVGALRAIPQFDERVREERGVVHSRGGKVVLEGRG